METEPCQPSQPESGRLETDPVDIVTETAKSSQEPGTTGSKREEANQFSPHVRSAKGRDAKNERKTNPDATQGADNNQPAVTTLTEATPPENGVYGATGTEAAVCADIAKRQRRGIAKYGTTVIGNLLSFHEWLTHFYEELLDAAIYAKRIIHEHENQAENHGGAAGVLPSNPGTVRIPRKPGGGRKPLVCPSCGGIKTIGSSMKDGIPIKRCKVCGHVHKSYPHLANAAKAAT
jgi:hypothetical protein